MTDQAFAYAPLNSDEAKQTRELLCADHLANLRRDRKDEWASRSITIGSNVMRLKIRTEGNKPPGGWPLFISLHGGGSAPAAVNDQQWDNQIRLYNYKDSKIIAPRAPTDAWNMWHEAHMDALFDRLIEEAVALDDVNPNRVYLQGYSAGGDGVYQLAPRMADRFAAAAMMAGHPNNANPLGLRNLPFSIDVGALDSAFDRNKVAGEWGEKLDALHAADADGYIHRVTLHAGQAHWMNLTDQAAVDWIQKFTRNAVPKRIVWKQNQVTHNDFYWLGVPPGTGVNNAELDVQCNGQTIDILKATNVKKLILRLDDRLVNCDQLVVVKMDGRELFRGTVVRTILAQQASLDDRGDRDLIFDGSITNDLSSVKNPATMPSTQPAAGNPQVLRAVAYLKSHLQDRDRMLSDGFLEAHAAAILADRESQPWHKTVPDEIFDEYVLPFATLDESREAWVDRLKPITTNLTTNAKTCGEAAEMLNAGIFDRLAVHYNATKRLRPDQSVGESTSSGFASCTGLSIILVNACRSVGVPARIVGVEDWVSPKGPTYQGNGNHTWVEVWDGRQWRFIGASEKSQLDQTWFADRAKTALEQMPSHAIFATCLTDSTDHFPMVWSMDDHSVPAVNVTKYYTDRKVVHVDAPADSQIMIRDQGRLVAAGAPGDFILAGKKDYSVEVIAEDGKTRVVTQHVN